MTFSQIGDNNSISYKTLIRGYNESSGMKIIDDRLTALKEHRTSLCVHRKFLEIHWTRERCRYPAAQSDKTVTVQYSESST